MSFSHETQEKINQFAKEQSRYYLDAAQMTYIEKLRGKAANTKRKAATKLARFKGSSNQAVEARNDMILYMSDYMSDLMSKGMSEQEALEKAKEELAASGDSEASNDYAERLAQYFINRDPAADEAIGLFYGGAITIGLVAGTLAGYIISGGQTEFLSGGWIDTAVGAGVGMLLGVGLGMVNHSIIAGRTKK